MVAFILAIISILFLFINRFLSLIIAVIALVLARKGMKNKEKYTKEANVISIIVIVTSVILMIVSFVYQSVTISNIIEETNEQVNEINGQYKD